MPKKEKQKRSNKKKKTMDMYPVSYCLVNKFHKKIHPNVKKNKNLALCHIQL